MSPGASTSLFSQFREIFSQDKDPTRGKRSTISKYFSIMAQSGFNVSQSVYIIPEDKAYKAQTFVLRVFIMLIRIGGGDFFFFPVSNFFSFFYFIILDNGSSLVLTILIHG